MQTEFSQVTHNFSTQSIHLDGVINARELGGYRMKDGRTVRHGLLLRGGALDKATDQDISRLEKEFDVKYIFDFRSGIETSYAADRQVPGSTYLHLPAIDPETGRKTAEIYEDLPRLTIEEVVLKGAKTQKMQEYAHSIYDSMVTNEYTQLQYATFLQKITELEDGAVYWHCSQGKDRTGLGAALLLAALGADRKTIIDDFAISAEYYEKSVNSLLGQVDTDIEKDVIRTMIGVNVDYFKSSLDLIDRQYGSMDNYLTSMLVISQGDMDRLRGRLLE